MSFHGGLVGLAIAVIYFTRSKGGKARASAPPIIRAVPCAPLWVILLEQHEINHVALTG
jgi:prolipoprotein diacylglyceryltransferase